MVREEVVAESLDDRKGRSVTTRTFDELLISIATGDSSAIPSLLASGFDINGIGGKRRWTPLMYAAYEGNSDVIRALVENGAVVNFQDEYQLTALHEAAVQGNCDAARTLLELGATVDAKTLQDVTPLMCAAAWGHCDVAKLLIEMRADISLRDTRGGDALMIAEEKGNDEVAELLEAAGARQ